MSDLFHDAVTEPFIHRVFETMTAASQHVPGSDEEARTPAQDGA
jgi:hypothetical protein